MLFYKKVVGLAIRAEEWDEEPQVTLEELSGLKTLNGGDRVRLSFSVAHELARKLRWAIEAATGQGRRSRESVFFDPDPGEILVYAGGEMVVLYLGSGDIVPNFKSRDPDAERIAAEIAGRGGYPTILEFKELIALVADEAGEVLEVLEAAIAAFE
jgi:hypothetical protein